MNLGTLYIISAPSGAGKTSLVHALVERMSSVVVSVSYTTRLPRSGEVDGWDYHFVSEQTFLQKVESGEFLEHAQVFDHYYGTASTAVTVKLSQDYDVVLEIDWQGARQVRQLMPECASIFILPPSLDALERRLRARGQDPDTIIERRMQAAVREMTYYAECDYLIINDDFERALDDLAAVISANHLRIQPQSRRLESLLQHLLYAANT